MNAQQLLTEISDYCRQTGLAESTFGRRAVNDGKLAARLRNGGRITTETLDRIRAFMDSNRTGATLARPAVIDRRGRAARLHRRATPPANQPMNETPPLTADRRTKIRNAISASSTTGRSTCCSSTPAAKSGWWRAASGLSLPTFIRGRRRCGCSTPASATAPCWCG